MNESDVDIDHIANLARIELSAEEKQKFSADFGRLLEYFEKLKSADVEGVEPCAHAFPVYNVLRDDVPATPLPTEALLKNAPAARDNQIVVPRIVDDAS
ncbi:MAG: Asp-tRNA(Asn)/Glu-tRNA(Gln) amidotransferase subunit GatC [Opitutae bacterium]|nr:Asp-tRNA(Asn)/Glu-tRNA(Gln) amidotransferase subunit GatC [Opitutae bacterium]MCD8298474.1 Asp-tRNA(Asn)/Glu-tRNA(Gln) amidotransferase subunit GatC [Opitutae bacterium]